LIELSSIKLILEKYSISHTSSITALKGEREMNKIGIKFAEGYRMLAWLSTQSIDREGLKNIICGIDRISSADFSQTPLTGMFCGFCFGKYDLIMDFWCQSGKVASHFASMVSDDIRRFNLTATFSSLLCKGVTHQDTSTRTVERVGKPSDGMIRSYINLRPSGSIDAVCQQFEKFTREYPELQSSLELLWNDSAYPLIIVLDGNIAINVIKNSINVREYLGDYLAESSTFLTLRFWEKDKNYGKLYAITFAKQLKFPSDIDIPFPMEKLVSQNPYTKLDCLGWYDYCLIHKAESLCEIEDRIFSLREKNHGKIYQTSTTLLREIPGKASSITKGK
jgi:hypothetical protein